MKKLAKLVMLTAIVFIAFSCGNTGGHSSSYNQSDYANSEEAKKEEKAIELEKYFSYRFLGEHRYDVEKHWVLDYGNLFNGLVVCYGNKEGSRFMMFDDEEDYYNDCVYEWTLALAIAYNLFYANNKTIYNLSIQRDENHYSEYIICMNKRDRDTLFSYRPVYEYEYRVYENDEETYVDTIRKLKDYDAIDRYGNLIEYGDTIKYYKCMYFEDNDEMIAELLDFVHCMPSCINDYNKNPEIVEIVKKTYYDLQDAAIYEPDKGYGYRRYPIDKQKYGFGYVELYRIKEGEYENVPGGALGIRFRSNNW